MSQTASVAHSAPAEEAVPLPRYEDEEAEALGEQLAELYARRGDTEDAQLEARIEQTRRELRRGPRLRAGEFLDDGRYRLIERLGDGPGDATWRAWDRRAGRIVAIKEMVGPWVAKRMRVGSFLESARTLQQLEHAGLPLIHAATQSRDGFVYLATEHLPGGRLDRFQGDAIDVLQAIVEVGNALHAAHEAGLVHARVRPEAIFFDSHGSARITDFDLAGEHVLGDSGSLFVAPEVVERGARALPTSDVYALAMCALYALNGGHLPYTVVRGPDRFIAGLDVADSVKTVLSRALDWDVGVRYATAAEMVADLLADADVLDRLAHRALDRGRHIVASEHFTALWALRPGDSVAIKHTLGRIYLEMQAWEEAYACLSSALEETDDPDPLYPELQRYAAGRADHKRVADLLWNEARERPPIARASMRAELARLTEAHLGDPRGAAEIWTLVVQDHRTVARGREAHLALTRLAEARADWVAFVEHATDCLPYLHADDRPELQYRIGRALLRELERVDEGVRWIEQACAGGIQPLDLLAELQALRARRGEWRLLVGLMRLEAANEPRVHQASRVLLRAATIARAVHLEAEAEAIYADMLGRAPQHYPALRELARIRHRTGRHQLALDAYQALTANYDGRSEEPEASERAADFTAYATLLIDHGRAAQAIEQLEAALQLQPHNLGALELVAPLYLDAGKLEDAALVLERRYMLFKSVDGGAERVTTALDRADVAWYRGRLAVAMRWYNLALAADPDATRAWWGLARVALAARGGHPGTDRAPWLTATPAGFTPQEALARLLLGVLDADAMRTWLARHPLGRGIVGAGDCPARLACAVVDVGQRYGLLGDAFFAGLAEQRPGWTQAIRRVSAALDGPAAEHALSPVDSYGWSAGALSDDFAPAALRRAVGCGRVPAGLDAGPLGEPATQRSLLDGQAPAAPPPEPSGAPAQTPRETVSAAPPVSIRLGEADPATLLPAQPELWVGADPACALCHEALEPRHLRVHRLAGDVYVDVQPGAEVRVDGRRVGGWRVESSTELALGATGLSLRVSLDGAGAEPPAQPSAAEAHAGGAQTVEPSVPEAAAGDEAAAIVETDADEQAHGATEDDTSSAGTSAEPPLDAAPDRGAPAPPPTFDSRAALDDSDSDVDYGDDDDGEEEVTLVNLPRLTMEQLEAAALREEREEREPSRGAVQEAAEAAAAAEVDVAPPPEPLEASAPTVMPSLADDDDSALDPVTLDPVARAPRTSEDASLAGDDPDASPSDDEDPLDALYAAGALEHGDDEAQDDLELDDPAPEDAGDDEDGWDDAPSSVATARFDVPDWEAEDAPEPPRARLVPQGLAPGDDEEDVGDEWTAATVDGDLAPFTEVPDEQDVRMLRDDDDDDDDVGFDASELVEHRAADPLVTFDPVIDDDAAPLDSLGPAGDAPTPQWLAAGDDDPDLISTQAAGPTLLPTAQPDLSALSGDDARPVRLPPGKPGVLEIMSGPSRGTSVPIAGTLTLGRDASCDVHLPSDPMLSYLHCRFRVSEAGYLIADNGSARGTMVDGSKVSEAPLRGGETIMVGSTVLRFVRRG